jgi:hypothetical protein
VAVGPLNEEVRALALNERDCLRFGKTMLISGWVDASNGLDMFVMLVLQDAGDSIAHSASLTDGIPVGVHR